MATLSGDVLLRLINNDPSAITDTSLNLSFMEQYKLLIISEYIYYFVCINNTVFTLFMYYS